MNSRPAITKRSSYIGPSPFQSLAEGEPPAADEAQNFHPIARFETADLEVLPIEDFTLSSSGRFTFSNIAVDLKVATRGAGYTIEWSKFDNVTDTASTIGETQTTTELSADAPAGALESEFVQVKVTGKHPHHPGWSLPCRVVFRKLADGWKLVGVERM